MNNELYHYGVPGMKWGVRKRITRDQYNEISYKRDSLLKSETKALYKQHGLKQKYDEAYKYAEKHHLDMDDGGGGSVKAGNKYLEMIEYAEKLEETLDVEASKKVTEKLIKEYGKETIDSFNKKKKRIVGGQIALASLGLLALPIARIIYIARSYK